ncbi:adenylate/guanylate cyclase domain-containing protein [Variovorax sp. OV329]|uniref:adenylate/guanylate cyclase domain-containing protein n=1 Tax=Variovorax sp. OV329 TaxID=1882825 RepID=UPI0008EC1B81|nr:adenylate/guanylate cyclase domain-containing protein [Variovorax sp. OV329]SFN42185.1 Adenylate cyclase, class 3 [Variovorax sp. OV329]
MTTVPETHYVKSGEVSIAYQVVGGGPVDLVLVPGWLSNIECFWEEPHVVRFLSALASFTRLIIFDKRGTGLSDRVTHMPSLETRMDDLRAVMSAARSERAIVCGYSEGGPLCALFAATYPSRTAGLVMIGSYASRKRSAEQPWGRTREELEAFSRLCETGWGGPVGLDVRAPSLVNNEEVRRWYSRFLRMSASPSAVVSLNEMNFEIDIRHVLPSIRVPTLVMHATGDRTVDVRASHYMMKHLPSAKYVELPSNDHLPWADDVDTIIREICAFAADIEQPVEPDRVLATVLFSDIVGSTERAINEGDRHWRELLAKHHEVVRHELTRHRGHEVDTAGDGFFATFDGPARAVRCAAGIVQALRPLGLEIRAGLHTGECETVGEKVAGIAVHIGARVASEALPGEVVVSSTVKDLVAGSGLRFEDRGVHTLKGIPEPWHLFAVDQSSARV